MKCLRVNKDDKGIKWWELESNKGFQAQWLTGYLRLGTNSGFRVGSALGWGGGGKFCFPGVFCFYWGNFYFGGGTERWAIIPWGLDTFLVFPNFL